jgi:mannose-6-phosphate isomerase
MAKTQLYPFIFEPIFKERVWGGRRLQELYQKQLPPGVPVGESWEITDRPGDVSRIANGRLAGRDLRWLLENHREEVMGSAKLYQGKFPLLIKILDAREKLSLQVHPPAEIAADLGGEPKTELWYIAEAEKGSALYVGLRKGCTRADFEQKTADGTVEECFHRVAVHGGDTMFLPSGRVHAIGDGLVIFEIQQNSDTTYRVYDWNRKGLDGKPRALHIRESLKSIQFNDFEPELVRPEPVGDGTPRVRLVTNPVFRVESVALSPGEVLPLAPAEMQIVAVVFGRLSVESSAEPVGVSAGQFCLVPASQHQCAARAMEACTCLLVRAGQDRVP